MLGFLARMGFGAFTMKMKVAIIGIAIVAALSALWGYGNAKYREGVRKTTAEFMKQDLEGAQDVREIAEDVLSGIGDDTDPDELLDATGGLRDEE